MKRWSAGLLACLLCWVGSSAGATGGGQAVRLYTFSAEEVPEELLHTAMQVHTQDVRLSLTFGGDCTLGGEPGIVGGARGFGGVVRKQGLGYPFAKLQDLFAHDDITVVNLEGVLSDEKEDPTPGKTFHFIGETGYAAILSLGSVEIVNLANNHVMDFGRRGYEDTLQALEGERVAYFGEETVTVAEKGGMRVGFTGSAASLGERQKDVLAEQMEVLRGLGCQWIVHTVHGGVEYDALPSARQRAAAAFAVENGANLVVGHHPHVVQGMELLGEVPVLYSLGNCSFGGNLRPRDMDACILTAELAFEAGELKSMGLTLWPIRVSGDRGSNNYQPVLATGEDAKRVMDKLQESSRVELAPYAEGQGAVQPVILYKGQGAR